MEKPDLHDQLLFVAETVGQLSERFDKIERDNLLAARSVESSKTILDGTRDALSAAIAGIKAIDSHILSNDLGKVSTRLDTVAAQADTALKALESQLATHAQALAAAKDETAKAFASRDAQRIELAQKRESDAQQFSAQIETARQEFSQRLAELADSISRFETPSSFNPRGFWDSQKSYARLDVVALNGSSYVSLVEGNGEKPSKTSKAWMLLAARGGSTGGTSTTADESATEIALTDGATVTWNVASSPCARVTLGGNRTLSMSNFGAGKTYILRVIQDSTGSRTLTWPSAIRWPGGTAPTLTTTASRQDIFSFYSDGTLIYGAVSFNFTTT